MSEKSMELRLFFLITTPKLADRATEIFFQEKIPLHYRLQAQGTATSEIMDLLGLGSIDKNILVSMMPKCTVKDLFQKLSRQLKLGTVNSGIAFTVPLTGTSNLMLRMLEGLNQDEKGDKTMSDVKYSLIAAVVNRGYSNDVMDAAKTAGASGGTLLNSRQVSTEEISSFWGLGANEEKEIVVIVSDIEHKLDIMKKIGECCGMQSEAKGVVFSLPIDSVMGLSRE